MISKKEIWLVHPGYEPALPMKIEILPGHAARITGGKTGSHMTGHGETYWDKIVEVIRLGFVPSEVAKDLGLIPIDWLPPNESELDEMIERGNYILKRQ
jgi:hypothetical protein